MEKNCSDRFSFGINDYIVKLNDSRLLRRQYRIFLTKDSYFAGFISHSDKGMLLDKLAKARTLGYIKYGKIVFI